jgi:hypothetical protein
MNKQLKSNFVCVNHIIIFRLRKKGFHWIITDEWYKNDFSCDLFYKIFMIP